MSQVPLVDLSCLRDSTSVQMAMSQNPTAVRLAADEICRACRHVGFFYISNYPMPPGVEAKLDAVSRRFFALPQTEKMLIPMSKGGNAWRGYFPVGGELTSGLPDLKEGIYFGEELPESDPRVRAGLPLHGPNIFPPQCPEMRPVVLEYFAACKELGRCILSLIAVALGLPCDYFDQALVRDPLGLFRIFHYPGKDQLPPALKKFSAPLWGVGEHTDYGLLTILKQDTVGGLEVKTVRGEWIQANPLPGTLVINIGDMLERMSGGLFRSTPHRVRNTTPDAMRLSFPFFFDPSFDARVFPIPLPEHYKLEAADRKHHSSSDRWDKSDVNSRDLVGTYGQYLVKKVGHVFPSLASETKISAKI